MGKLFSADSLKEIGYPFKAGQHAGATNEVCLLTNFVCRSTVPAKVDSQEIDKLQNPLFKMRHRLKTASFERICSVSTPPT
jgi:hypothetical protein